MNFFFIFLRNEWERKDNNNNNNNSNIDSYENIYAICDNTYEYYKLLLIAMKLFK